MIEFDFYFIPFLFFNINYFSFFVLGIIDGKNLSMYGPIFLLPTQL